jgi:predicted acylesterase/phospholipase RssA
LQQRVLYRTLLATGRKIDSVSVEVDSDMPIRFLIFVLLAAGLVLEGCAHERPAAVAGCRLRATPLLVSDLHPQSLTTDAGTANNAESPFALEIKDILHPDTADMLGETRGTSAHDKQWLVLSGGSQHGAFGTGFYNGISSTPTFDLVTGVSTGALQSTFLFLANDAVPADRVYPVHRGFHPDKIKPGTSNAGDLAIATSINSERDILDVGSFGLLGAVARGSQASFAPLRARLLGLISKGTLIELGAARAAHRRLYVGVTDLDEGVGYAIDLTELASRVTPASTASQVSQIQHCYIDALIASSSVPLGAFPVPLEVVDTRAPPGAVQTHLFVDGGARFGVFLKQVADEMTGKVDGRVNVSLIVNGSLYDKPWTAQGKPVTNWSLLTLAARTVDQLENQTYRFSVDGVERLALAHGTLKMAYISNQNLTQDTEQADDHLFDGKTCAAWAAIDDEKKPIEFHAHYMECLFDYGRQRGADGQWNIALPRDPLRRR